MGLIQANRQRYLAGIKAWTLPGIVVAVAAILALTGDMSRDALAYTRDGIAAGEAWRLVSAHFVHINWPHFLLNAAGLLLVCYLVGPGFTGRQWLVISLWIIAGIDVGFWLLDPQLEWYVGLSGLLHGLLAAGLVPGLRAAHRDSWFLGIAVLSKIIYEQIVGPIPGSEASIGAGVIVNAHLYGAITGSVVGTVFAIRVRPPASI